MISTCARATFNCRIGTDSVGSGPLSKLGVPQFLPLLRDLGKVGFGDYAPTSRKTGEMWGTGRRSYRTEILMY